MKLITHLQNLRYLIGFTGSHGYLLMGKKNFFFTDFRYSQIAKNLQKQNPRVSFEFVEMDENLEKKLQKILKTTRQIEFEEHHLTLAKLKSWKKRLKRYTFKPLKQSIEELRAQKDSKEIKLLKKSQEINEETLHRIKKLFKPGLSELEIAWKIKEIGHHLGADDISFEPIVAFGAHSAIPHHQNTSKKLKQSDLILIDMGMKYKGYCSDMTRTFLPKKPTSEQIAVYQTVKEAQNLAIQAIKAGIKASKPDRIARKFMGKAAKDFGHSLGHGIGLDVHESPTLSQKSKDTLKENMIVTVEPGLYLPGKFGVRIEDMGRVTQTGYENFTHFEK